MTIDGVQVKGITGYDLASRYVAETKARVPDVSSITVTEDGDDAKVEWTAHHTKFERIRRVTGYLVGTLDRWNDAKYVKHAYNAAFEWYCLSKFLGD